MCEMCWVWVTGQCIEPICERVSHVLIMLPHTLHCHWEFQEAYGHKLIERHLEAQHPICGWRCPSLAKKLDLAWKLLETFIVSGLHLWHYLTQKPAEPWKVWDSHLATAAEKSWFHHFWRTATTLLNCPALKCIIKFSSIEVRSEVVLRKLCVSDICYL